jgi:hypothetical protein
LKTVKETLEEPGDGEPGTKDLIRISWEVNNNIVTFSSELLDELATNGEIVIDLTEYAS